MYCRPAAQCRQFAVAHGKRIGEEHQVEFAALGGLRQLHVMLEIGAGIDLRLRMQPGGDVVAGRMKEGAKLRHLVGAIGSHWVTTPARRRGQPSATITTVRRTESRE
jgi:hypothetical protein